MPLSIQDHHSLELKIVLVLRQALYNHHTLLGYLLFWNLRSVQPKYKDIQVGGSDIDKLNQSGINDS